MAETVKIKKAELKATKWRVIGMIVVALLGLCGTALSLYLSKTSASQDGLEQLREATASHEAIEQMVKKLEGTARTNEFLVQDINVTILPAIQKALIEIQRVNVELRERVAYLEGIITGRKHTSWGSRIAKGMTKEIELPSLELRQEVVHD